MNKLLPLLTLALLLLTMIALPPFAEAGQQNARQSAIKTLVAHKKSKQRCARVPLSAYFLADAQQEDTCVSSIAEGIGKSSLFEDEKFFSLITILYIYSIDYGIGAAKDKAAFLKKEGARLERASRRITRKASSKRGRAIARSLKGHKIGIASWASATGTSFDFCALQDRIETAGGYTLKNIEQALEETASGTWVETAAEDGPWTKMMQRSDKIISRGQERMRKVRPKISRQKIENYSTTPNFYLGMDYEPKGRVFTQKQALELRKNKSANKLVRKAASLIP